MSVGKARALNRAQEGRGTWTRRPSDGMGAPCPAWCCSHLRVLSFGFAHMCVCVFLCPHGGLWGQWGQWGQGSEGQVLNNAMGQRWHRRDRAAGIARGPTGTNRHLHAASRALVPPFPLFWAPWGHASPPSSDPLQPIVQNPTSPPFFSPQTSAVVVIKPNPERRARKGRQLQLQHREVTRRGHGRHAALLPFGSLLPQPRCFGAIRCFSTPFPV